MPEQTPVPPFRHRLPREVADRIRSTAPPPPPAPRAHRALPRLAVAAAAARWPRHGNHTSGADRDVAVVDAWPVKWTAPASPTPDAIPLGSRG